MHSSEEKDRAVMKRLLKVLSFVPAILIAMMIFGFSAQNAEESSSLSTEITTDIVVSVNENFDKNWTPREIRGYVRHFEFYVRKLAHFSEYLLLGLALCLPLYLCGAEGRRLGLYIVLICFLYACTDEFHQHFLAGRSPQLRDVCIDTAGGFTGFLLAWLLFRLLKNRLLRPLVREHQRVVADKKRDLRHRTDAA